MFVSESFLIGSARDHKAVVIEKTPDALEVYESKGHQIQCANHYQSPGLGSSELNRQQMEKSASVYRYERLQELLKRYPRNTPAHTASILRDYKGHQDRDIGLTNEKALNQFIAHHAVIFKPEQGLMWVSTSPWQMGTFVCYNLNEIFGGKAGERLHAHTALNIEADTLLKGPAYLNVKTYLQLEQQHIRHQSISIATLLQVNPNYYDTWRIAGEQYEKQGKSDSARWAFQKALTLEVATEEERQSIKEKILKIKSQ
jgi:tetratricopeptide (TPR) repeat protein